MNKESYSYYKTSYKANKRYRDKQGRDDYAGMLNKTEYEELRESGLTTKEIVYNQFHFYTKSVAEKIQKSLKQEGFDISMKKIQSREYSKEVYDRIKELYAEFTKDGLSSKEASMLISYTFFGSWWWPKRKL